ncbi:aminoglycoside phosphotransferase family protein [Streptomyces sp. NBC_01361]|uniref:aminoglycoside phosphotransferase family protein n=1 Tax=Streptomyces sp. NBC_01361 TaxID=2903838 RepID=UPI002E2F2317|nr:aminoglycoside phosphotransferase family protein [Streptomyces sp. NBC_01361]
MGASHAPSSCQRGSSDEDIWDRFRRQAALEGESLSSHHHRNYVIPLAKPMARRLGQAPGTRVTVRVRKTEALPVVIRTWPDEKGILDAIGGVLPNVPQCLFKRADLAIHSYVEGVPLSSVCPNGKPVDSHLISALAGLLADMTRVSSRGLPPLPDFWPRRGRDSGAFLRALARAAEEQIRKPNWTAFGGLFAALGIAEDALTRFAERVPTLMRRPFSLLHGDLHRDNVIVSYHGDPPLICVDWELATYGDPLHDLATHLVRMDYPEEQWAEVTGEWREAMQCARSEATVGLGSDLRHYIDFEHAQSVYPDVIRAVTSLGDSFSQRDLDVAAQSVHRALRRAEKPLRLTRVPDVAKIEPILFRWREAQKGRYKGKPTISGISWTRDQRVPEHPEFPERAVVQALLAEGGATADQVFKGTAHLSTVVRVPAVGFPVMVRRKAGSVSHTERRFLDEHAVLRAIEQSRGAVRAPRVLALGVSNLEDQFSIHSYEGPSRGLRPPEHPVDGLLPHEADDLVDQLCALTQVDTSVLDAPMGSQSFYAWLGHELVRLVDGLPKESRQLANKLGLPGARWLEWGLGRHVVSPRGRALLHGDLNPWNLVRREDGGLTLIDWEMAMVGDPLYDLVRHMHLTPTKSEIRQRMFARWTRQLPERFTNGWRADRHVYRSIEIVRSAYVDLDRLVTGAGLDAPNVLRAVGTYATTLHKALAWLGMPPGRTNPYLARALPSGDHGHPETAGVPTGV